MSLNGYRGGSNSDIPGQTPVGIARPQRYAGGSHGGLGLDFRTANQAGEVYGSVSSPREAGGGGARGDTSQYGGHGGGVLMLEVGNLVLNGEILARGGDVSNSYAGTGAGGTVVIDAQSVSGIGLIDASGGDDKRVNSRYGGLGGGGRVVLTVGDVSGFDVVEQIYVEGGSRHETDGTINLDAAAGTAYVRGPSATFGDLIVHAHAPGRDVPPTTLPALGVGVVTLTEASGADAWITGESALRIRWAGAYMRLRDAGGVDLGRFLVLDVDADGRALLENAAAVSATAVGYSGEYVFDQIKLLGGARLDADDPVIGDSLDLTVDTGLPSLLVAEQLTVRSGATVSASTGNTLDLVVGTLTVESGAAVSMDSRGYAGGHNSHYAGYGPTGIVQAERYGGGSHGGIGRDGKVAGRVGEVYGSVYMPKDQGAGGARGDTNQYGGKGGGAISIDAMHVVLDGSISSNGGQVSDSYGGAGAGGSVLLQAQSLTGSGAVHAEGGDDQRINSRYGGLGGGGRVALWADTISGFDPVTQVFAQGGSRLETNGTISVDAAPGTVFVKRASETWGELIVQGHTPSRQLPATLLPDLSAGTVDATEVVGSDLWITGTVPFQSRWHGVWVALEDASGTSLGSFRASQRDVDGRLLLEGAHSASSAVVYSGDYRFDSLRVLGGGGLDASVPITATSIDLRDQARLPRTLQATNLTVRAGAQVTPAVGGELLMSMAGSLVVEAGATLDVSARGYAGGSNSDYLGHVPDGIVRPQRYAGGSHGGLARDGKTVGHVGEVYDSVYVPSFAGGGGARGDTNQYGGWGGGLLIVEASAVVLEGEILARGGSISDSWGGTGAGGTVHITATSLGGSGTIDASGGDDNRINSRYGGLGGGGRVALWVDDVSAFGLEQVRVEGGSRIETSGSVGLDAAPGTLFVRDAQASYGDLIVDAHTGGVRVVPKTSLPDLVAGAVALAEAVDAGDPATDVWLSGGQPFQTRWLGTWVRLTSSDGSDLGTFRVIDLDVDGRLLLDAAGPAATTASDYAGAYLFDDVIVRGGAGLDAGTPVSADSIEVAGDPVLLPPDLVVTSLRVPAAARLVVSRGDDLSINATGTVTVEAGGIIDMTSQGYSGGDNSDLLGDAPVGALRPARYGGGAHGGDGADGRNAGSAGSAFDSVYAPSYSGGGGARGDTSQYGGGGGGILRLSAAHLVLEGELRSRGGGITNSYGGTGAGGTVVVAVDELSGAGLIDVSGGDNPRTNSRWAGLGGGGRVWIDAGLLTGFDPHTQVTLRGGLRSISGNAEFQAGAGTLLLQLPSSTYGDLIINQGAVYPPITIMDTPLAVIGSGTLGTVEADLAEPADLWVEDADLAAVFGHAVTGSFLRIGSLDYRILALSDDLRSVLLEGAAAAVVGGETYQGVYKFDNVALYGRATLTYGDLDEVGTYTTDPEAQIVRPGS